MQLNLESDLIKKCFRYCWKYCENGSFDTINKTLK